VWKYVRGRGWGIDGSGDGDDSVGGRWVVWPSNHLLQAWRLAPRLPSPSLKP
jgi:hypothetical protein